MPALPKDDGDFIIDTDASEVALGAVLSQVQEGEERPKVYFSGLYSRTDVNYCTTRKEWLAMVEALRQLRPFVLGRHFRVRTNHAALRWFQRAPSLVGHQAHWLDLLCEFDRPGYKHGNADALSRRSCRSFLFCRKPRESEYMATLTSPETRPDSEDRWAPSRWERGSGRIGNLRG